MRKTDIRVISVNRVPTDLTDVVDARALSTGGFVSGGDSTGDQAPPFGTPWETQQRGRRNNKALISSTFNVAAAGIGGNQTPSMRENPGDRHYRSRLPLPPTL